MYVWIDGCNTDRYVCIYVSMDGWMDGYAQNYINVCIYVQTYMSCRGGFGTIKSFVHALSIYLQMTESTTNSTSCIFIKQLSNSDLQ